AIPELHASCPKKSRVDPLDPRGAKGTGPSLPIATVALPSPPEKVVAQMQRKPGKIIQLPVLKSWVTGARLDFLCETDQPDCVFAGYPSVLLGFAKGQSPCQRRRDRQETWSFTITS